MTVSLIELEAYILCQLEGTRCQPEWDSRLKLIPAILRILGLLILKVADGTAGSLLAFFEHWMVSFHSTSDARY
jgi:hypothetical protein